MGKKTENGATESEDEVVETDEAAGVETSAAAESKRMTVIVHRLEKGAKGPIYAFDGSTGEKKEFDEGKPVSLSHHMIEGLKHATFPDPVDETDEKTGQVRTTLVNKRRFSIEEA